MRRDGTVPAERSGDPSRRDIIVIRASAAASLTPCAIAGALTPGYPRPSTVLIVAHVGQSRSLLPDLLRRSGGTYGLASARRGADQEGTYIDVAPPDRHVLIEDGKAAFRAAPENILPARYRPARFARPHEFCGDRVIGVVLSGRGSDGAVGLAAIRNAGGLAVVEDPSDAAFPDMPRTAALMGEPHFVARPAQIPASLVRLSTGAVPVVATPARERPAQWK